jgi:hypothetical protein
MYIHCAVNIAKYNKFLNQSASEKLYLYLWNYTKLVYLCHIIYQDPDVFVDFFKNAGTEVGGVQLRFNYYPKIADVELKPGQIRCGEHTDYGGITLLMQDDAGGLEARN